MAVMILVMLALPRLFRLGIKGYRFRSALLVNVVLVVVVAALAIAAPIVMETSFLDYVYRTHYTKLFEEGGSGSVRLATVTSGVKVFLSSPVLGVGYGSHRTGSLLTSLLSNVGILGTLAFFLFNVIVFRRGLRVCRNSDNRHLVSICYALLVSFSTLLPVMLIGKSIIALVQGWYWLLLALVEGCYRIHRQETQATASAAEVAPSEGGAVIAAAPVS
jgi:O-antigen ligase